MSLEEKFRAFLEEHPTDPMVLLSLGSICLREGRLEEAEALLERAIRADPYYVAVYPVLGECRERLGKVEEAREAYRRALELAKRVGDGTMVREMTVKLDSLSEEF